MGTSKMKIDLCNYSGYKVYPSRGITYIKADGKTFRFLDGRSKKAHRLKRNPRKVTWTVLYRRKHQGRRGGDDQEEDEKDPQIPAGYSGSVSQRDPGQAQPEAGAEEGAARRGHPGGQRDKQVEEGHQGQGRSAQGRQAQGQGAQAGRKERRQERAAGRR